MKTSNSHYFHRNFARALAIGLLALALFAVYLAISGEMEPRQTRKIEQVTINQ